MKRIKLIKPKTSFQWTCQQLNGPFNAEKFAVERKKFQQRNVNFSLAC